MTTAEAATAEATDRAGRRSPGSRPHARLQTSIAGSPTGRDRARRDAIGGGRWSASADRYTRPVRRERSHRGFTLVEALVVISILIVLVGLLFPVIGRIQAEAHSTGCLSNLRQLHGGIDAFRSANASLLPNTDPIPVVTPGGPVGGLPWALRSYIPRDNPAWRCPGDFDPESYETGTSYLYLPGLYVLTPEVQFQLPPNALFMPPRQRKELEARVVTALYERAASNTIPVLLDTQERHKIGDRVPRNALYIDGSARIAAPPEPLEPETALD